MVIDFFPRDFDDVFVTLAAINALVSISHNRMRDGAGAGLFRWRSHANEGVRMVERMKPDVETMHDLLAAQ